MGILNEKRCYIYRAFFKESQTDISKPCLIARETQEVYLFIESSSSQSSSSSSSSTEETCTGSAVLRVGCDLIIF